MARTEANNKVDYLLKGIPGDLWDRCKHKAEVNSPPLSMRWVLIQLLERWAPADAKPQRVRTPKPPKASVTPKAEALPTREPRVVGATPVERPQTPQEGVDLGDSF